MDDGFERLSPVRWAAKRMLIDPLANYLPAGLFRALLKFGKSEMAAANWADPGGWRSMVISYQGQCRQVADKILIGSGVMAMALRNRRRLAVQLLKGFIDSRTPPVHVLCLGAGPGHIIVEAMSAATSHSLATLVDLNPDAFEYGRQLAERHGVGHRVKFVHGDVREVRQMLETPPAIVKMIGICEYLTDEQIVSIVSAVREVMPPGAPILFNNLTLRHGNDRFFRRVLGLHMNHRSVEELSALMQKAGFGRFEAHPEPLGVYSVIVGYRQ